MSDEPAVPTVPDVVRSSTPDAERIANNVSVMVSVQLLSWVFAFVVTLFVPRYLGPEGFGRLTTAGAFISVGMLLAPWGLAAVVTKEIARTPHQLVDLVVNALLVRMLLAIVFGIATLIAGYLLDYRGSMMVLIAIGVAGALIAGINEIFAAALAGEERFKRHGFVTLVDKAVASGGALALVVLRAPITLFALPAVAASLVQAGMHIARLRSVHRSRADAAQLSRARMRMLLSAGLPYLGQGAFLTLYGQTDVLVLSLVSDYRSVGWYNVAGKLLGTTLFFPVAVSAALLPTFTRLHQSRDEMAFLQLGRRSLELVLVVGIPIAVVMLLIPDVIIGELYTAEFFGSINVLRIGGVCSLLYYVTIILCTMINARDHQKRLASVFVVVCIAGVPTCLLFSSLSGTYLGNAAIGAVFSDAIIELALSLSLLRMVPRGLLDRETVRQLGRFALAAVPMAAFLGWAFRTDATALWIVAPSLGLYLLCLWILGAIQSSYIDLVRSLLQRRR